MSWTEVLCTLNSAYKEKKYAEILLRYRQLFIKGSVFIGEWGIFGAVVFLHYSRFFIKGDFLISRVECMYDVIEVVTFDFHPKQDLLLF